MRIKISTEILGKQPSEDVSDKLLDTINAMWMHFDTVPEKGSLIEVDMFSFLFRFTMENKTYKYDGKDLDIILTYRLTEEVL
jgi:hypothetical protein|tara:strand:- start:106 stop:351 length:246 start_codon:yes stop_codon:yes gene_type:complete